MCFKRSLSYIFILFFSTALWAELSPKYLPVVNFFTPEFPEINIKQNLQFNLLPDSKEQGLGLSTIAEFNMRELQGDIGVNYTNHQLDFTTQIIYWPTFFNILNFGVGFSYHLNDYLGVYLEQDFLADLYTKIRIGKYFMAWTRWGGLIKLADIKDISPDFQNKERAMNFNLVLTWYPADLWSCYFSFESNSYFNYPNFMSVFFNTGAEFEVIEDKFSTGIDLCTKWYDFLVAAQNLSQLNIKIFGRYKL